MLTPWWWFGSLLRALGLVVFIIGRWVHSRMPWLFLCSSGVVGFSCVSRWCSCGTSRFVGLTGGYSGGPWVHTGWLGVVGFIQVGWVHSCAPWSPWSSSGVFVFTCVHSGGRWDHLGPLGSLACAWVFVGFICRCWAHSREPWVVWFMRVNHWLSLGSLTRALAVVGFIRGPRVHWPEPFGLLDLLACALGVVGFIKGRWAPSREPRGMLGSHALVLWWSMGSLARALAVVVFILGSWIYSRACWGSLGSPGVVGCTRVRAWGRSVQPRSFCSLARTLVVVGYISFRWVH